MPSTYTTNNGIELIGTGEQSGTWGDTTNTNLTLVDASLDGHTSITLTTTGTSGSPNDVPITDGATSNGRNRALIFTDGSDLGGSVYVRLTPNDAKKIMFVRNSLSGSRDLILFQGTYNASNDFVLAAGKDAIVKFDGGGTGAVASAVLENFALDAATITTISNTTLNTATVNATTVNATTVNATTANATTVDTTNIEVTNLKAKDGTSAGSIADSTGVVTLASSVLTTTDINGGTVDGVTIGGSSAGVGTFTTANATTVDTTNIEVTNLKAKDGTSAGSIADSTGVVTLDQLQLGTTAIDAADADAALTPGFYKWSDLSSGASNWPSDFTSGPAALQVFPSMNANNLVQVAWLLNNPEELYVRSYRSSSFKTWRKVLVEDANGDISVSNDLLFGDNGKAIFGAGSDLSIYHDGSNSYIEEAGTGDLKISGNNLWLEDASGNTYFRAVNSSYAKMYHSGSEKLATTSTGIDVTGNAAVSGTAKIGGGADAHGNADELAISKDQTNVGMSILAEDATGVSRLLFGTQTDTSAAKVQHNASSNQLIVQAAGDLRLQTGGTNDRVRVDSSGDVGIGISSPSARLEVADTSGAVGVEVTAYRNGATYGNSYIQFNGPRSSSSDGATLDGRGAITLLGNSSSTAGSLWINAASASLLPETADEATMQGYQAGLNLNSSGELSFWDSGTQRFFINSSGNVGIGTSSPSEELHVVSANGTALRLEATNTSTAGGIDFYGKDAGGTTYQAGNINAAGGTGSLEFSADPTDAEASTRVTFLTDGAERVRIDDTGLGIGTTSPAQALDVTGNAAVSGKAKIGTGADGSANGDELVLSKTGNNIGMTILCNDATGNSRIYLGSQTDTQAARLHHSEGNDRLFLQAKGELHFQTGGTNTTMTLNTSGDLDIDGDFTAAGVVNGTVGVGQTWQDVSGSRSANTSYQNTTGQPIQWAIHGSSGQEAQVSSNGTTWIKVATLGAPGSFETAATPVIPDNYYYRTTGSFSTWVELR